MPNRPFRFIHTSDLHLDRLPPGLDDLPDALRDSVLEAPYRAAERVFEAAVREQADFVLLAGDVLNFSSAGPRALALLSEQFERLNQRQIEVYWADGPCDRLARWSSSLKFPSNVHLFVGDQVEEVLHMRSGQPLVQILGAGCNPQRAFRPAHFVPNTSEVFSIALTYGRMDGAPPRELQVGYWALGGRHARRSATTPGGLVHYCGSPQGYRPGELGPHGCTLVEVDDARRVRTRFIPTDVLRWQRETFSYGPSADRQRLEQALGEHAETVLTGAAGLDLLVQWTVDAPSALTAELRRGALAADLLKFLRARYGQRRPALWSVSVDCQPIADTFVELQRQETLLGEFLRTINALEADQAQTLDLERYLPEHRVGGIAAAVQPPSSEARAETLREAALLGIELLQGEAPKS